MISPRAPEAPRYGSPQYAGRSPGGVPTTDRQKNKCKTLMEGTKNKFGIPKCYVARLPSSEDVVFQSKSAQRFISIDE